eukprot:TRINITY_DN24899_c0_g3_i1.p1 TRINITY_DN24899_c0_g3~~TRINITY_DN24899_c0_g3_i1.p1  ORF type:complete len:329 (+),score=94.77 TRINITY_DN24899_c0_g3_i1:74-988(+)
MASAGAQRGAARGGARFRQGEAAADFPILCETCLGPSKMIRMQRAEYDKSCKVCERPMTIFRWKPGGDSRYKTTVLCQTCAKLKNVCQCCIFDLDFGLPTAVRDHYAPGEEVVRHSSEVQREYFADMQEKALSGGQLTMHTSGETRAAQNADLQRLARRTPFYNRNRPRICSFFVKGECRRGKECPYRHEMPDGGELADQNIKDRYYGQNDPVANKIFRLYREKQEQEKEVQERSAAGAAGAAAAAGGRVPLPAGPAPATYYEPAPAPGQAAPAYPSATPGWMGERAGQGAPPAAAPGAGVVVM